MNWTLVISTVITVSLALAGYLATYLNNVRLSQRQDRLARVNRQLSELYGPLFALVQSSLQIYNEFSRRHVRDVPPTQEQKREYQLWYTTVFMPTNRRMYELVLSKADLLIEQDMPPVLLQLCAHVAGYEITARRWESGDYSEHLSVIPFPEVLVQYAQESFRSLKQEQRELIRHRPAVKKVSD